MTSPAELFSALRLNDLSLQVHLGCAEEERRKTQEVRVSIEVRFAEPPPGSRTDRLEDTVCYGELSSRVRQALEGQPFNLIEKMAQMIFALTLELLGPQDTCSVEIHKVMPPVPDLRGGAVFRLGNHRP